MEYETRNRPTATAPAEAQRQRVQLDFTPQAFERLNEIKKLAGAKTNAEIVRNAIRLYEWFLKQDREGYKLQLVRGDTAKEVEIVF